MGFQEAPGTQSSRTGMEHPGQCSCNDCGIDRSLRGSKYFTECGSVPLGYVDTHSAFTRTKPDQNWLTAGPKVGPKPTQTRPKTGPIPFQNRAMPAKTVLGHHRVVGKWVVAPPPQVWGPIENRFEACNRRFLFRIERPEETARPLRGPDHLRILLYFGGLRPPDPPNKDT